MNKKKTEKKIKTSFYFDSDVADMLQNRIGKYHPSIIGFTTWAFGKYLQEETRWR